MDMIKAGFFSHGNPDTFKDVTDNLLYHDRFIFFIIIMINYDYYFIKIMIIIIIYHKLKIEFYEYYKTDSNIDIFKH